MGLIYGTVEIDGKKVRKPILLEMTACKVCGKLFDPPKQESLYCSRKCGKKAEYERNKAKYITRTKEYYKDNKDEISRKRKDAYWNDPEKWRTKTRKYNELNKDKKKQRDDEYKDKTRHDGKRKELLEGRNYTCAKCKETKNSYQLVAHHTTFDANDHECQELLCRSCHAKVHKFGA